MVSCGLDGCVRVWDVRQEDQPVASFEPLKGSQVSSFSTPAHVNALLQNDQQVGVKHIFTFNCAHQRLHMLTVLLTPSMVHCSLCTYVTLLLLQYQACCAQHSLLGLRLDLVVNTLCFVIYLHPANHWTSDLGQRLLVCGFWQFIQ